ncbi:Nuclear factor related to kappa-B-binding protein [Melia azedarach]|uniref:Nuclear factor related to kappa-B-binding protein n=1 Tax=Melia azedarach TaxID=155640 RepID=A0ACC1YSA6_MELAZ|nr:Nuclear factor related to kappa-B-binding protein [Melia azedarach]
MSRGTTSSDEDELQKRSSAVDESSDDDEYDDADSGAGSDDFDLLELGETGAEFCQVGNLTCGVPFELYDLPGLEDILSVDVWNELLSEEEKFGLTKFLPDMDQDTFMRTLKQLFEGENFHFGSPIKKLFDMLKGGLCEPRVALYREGFNFFQKRKHYHLLRKHQNAMVSNFCQIRDAWSNCRGYSIEEKLRVLNIMKSQKSLMYEKMEDLESDSSGPEESGDGFWGKKIRDGKALQKMGHHSPYAVGSNSDFPSRRQLMGLEPLKYGKLNAKGILKTAGSKMPSGGHFPSGYHGMDMNSGLYSSGVSLHRQNKATGYESGASLWKNDQFSIDDDDDVEDPLFGMGVQRGRNVARSSVLDKTGALKRGKKSDILRGDVSATDSFIGLSMPSKRDVQVYGKNKNVSQFSDAKAYSTKPFNMRTSYEFAKKPKHPENSHQTVGDYMKSLKGRAPQLSMKGSRADLTDNSEPVWHNRIQGEVLSPDFPFKSDDWNIRSKKWKAGRESSDLNFKSYKASSPQMSDRYLHSEFRMKPSQEKSRGKFSQNGGPDMATLKGNRMLVRNEETESDSSDQFDEDDDDDDSNPLMRSKLAYPSGVIEGSRSSLLKPGIDAKKAKLMKKDIQENERALDGITNSSKTMGGFGEHARMLRMENYSSKRKQKGKMRDNSPLQNSAVRVLEDSSLSGLGKFKDDGDRKPIYKLGKNGQLRGEPAERMHLSSLKASAAERKQRAELAHEYIVDEENDLLETRSLVNGSKQGRAGKKGHSIEGYARDRRERSEPSLQECNLVMKKRKSKEDVMDVDGRDKDQQVIDDSSFLKKKGKRKFEADAGTPDMETSEPPFTEAGTADIELETKPQKKPFTLITPTVHTGFSFSIIHLLSAVRMAMITPLTEDSLEVEKPREEQKQKQEGEVNGVLSTENADVNTTDHAGTGKLPSLTVQEIVNRLRSNPGDPCILETQEPLQDLVRGVLKIYSSKTAPLGAKGWKALVTYEKPTKSWSWIGPVSHSSTDHEPIEEVTSPEAWGLPHKMLVKLVDSFANWLKSGQETLQQIGSLPAPPASLLHFNQDEKDRFRDLRAQKSLNTISPSTEEVRAYFRQEEVLRYSIPDRAFSYTAADGKKSIVAPLRRCGGKPTSKARDHFMLKRDRPPHVTILCLVRDAAARLPGSIGTRADVCTLIRDSQYIVEDVSDAQVNQVVSGALDRLHYERDPCVQFDSERKLWVYLHREREEEDFEDDGTSSTKKWKRQKKDPAEQSEQGAVTVAFHGTGDQSGFEAGSDPNVEPPCNDDDKKLNSGDNVDNCHGSEQGNMHQGHPMDWEALDLNPVQENKLLCQENSTNEDFDDEAFGRERPVGLLSASL